MREEAIRGGYECGSCLLSVGISFFCGGIVGVGCGEFDIWTRKSLPVG